MKTLSYSQQQLLNVLQIAQLKLAAAFIPEVATESPVETENIAEPVPLTAADLDSVLAQDIQLVLPTGVSWYIDQQISAPQLKNNQLITPALTALLTVEAKRALWKILWAIDEN